MRKLENVVDDAASETERPESRHPIRHEKKNRHRLFNSTFSRYPIPKKVNATDAIIINNNDTTVISFKTSSSENNSLSKDGTEEIFKKKLNPHENCYTSNEVLQIIAITCLVNFIFWFLIISSVNFCTKNQKIWKSDR